MHRRTAIRTIPLIASAALAGCVTHALFADHEYVETISLFLLSEDGRKLVVLGDKFHYVFDASPDLVRLLSSPIRPQLSARFEPFHIGRDGRVRGVYHLAFMPPADGAGTAQAEALGFRRQGAAGLFMTGSLSGQRFDANGLRADRVASKFNQPYTVKMREAQSSTEVAAKSLLTPVTLAADGVLLIGTMALFVVALPVAMTVGGS